MTSINELTFRGRVWKFGDSVDTNQLAGGSAISSGGIVVSNDPMENLKANCLRALRPDFPTNVQPGDLIVAGKNFGNGSGRRNAVLVLQAFGLGAVVAESVARIHRRNSIALAFPTFVVPGITELVDDGDEMEVDYKSGVVRNLTTGHQLPMAKLPESVELIYEYGGIWQILKQRLLDQGILPASDLKS